MTHAEALAKVNEAAELGAAGGNVAGIATLLRHFMDRVETLATDAANIADRVAVLERKVG